MGNDDTSSKRTRDPAFQTMPPELRPFVVPGPKNAIEPGENPRLDAAMAGLHALDEMDAAERRAAQAAGSVKEHVAAVVVPEGAKPKEALDRDRVKVAVPVLEGAAPRALPAREKKPWAELPEGKPILESQALIVDEDRLAEQEAEWARDKARAEAGKATAAAGTGEPAGQGAGSPWVKEAGAGAEAAVRASALPSSMRPREVKAPASEKPAGAAARERPKGAVLITVAVVLVAAVIGVRALTSGRTSENGALGPAPTATATAGAATVGPVTPPVPVPSVVPVPVPSASATSAAVPAIAPSVPSAPGRLHAAPKASSVMEDPYPDAAVKPSAAPSAEPVAPAPAPPPPPTAAPRATAPGNTFDKPNYD